MAEALAEANLETERMENEIDDAEELADKENAEKLEAERIAAEEEGARLAAEIIET